MPNFAIIKDGKVVNTVVAEFEHAAKQGWELIPEGSLAGIGWDHINDQFVDNRPAPVAPPAAPTKEELLAQLNALAAQIQASE